MVMAEIGAVLVPEASVESSASGVHWGAIVAGALGAVGITLILITLGPRTHPQSLEEWLELG